jgi:hypothetical protein
MSIFSLHSRYVVREWQIHEKEREREREREGELQKQIQLCQKRISSFEKKKSFLSQILMVSDC